jgi:hypothetical protein
MEWWRGLLIGMAIPIVIGVLTWPVVVALFVYWVGGGR